MTQRVDPERFTMSRRSILAGASALLALTPFAAKTAGEAVTRRIAITDLVSEARQPTQRARELVGQVVSLRGYAAPSSLGAATVLALTEGSAAPCQLCGSIHDVGPAVLVTPKEAPPASLSMMSMVDVRGRLDVGDGDVRLMDATIQIL